MFSYLDFDTSGVVADWRVTVGQRLQVGQDIAVIKSPLESYRVQAQADGVVFRLGVQLGDVYKAGQPLIYLQSEMPMEIPNNPKVALRPAHLTDEFWQWINDHCEGLPKESKYSRSEVIRAALWVYREMSQEQRLKVLAKNRKREIASRYGSGKFPSRRSPLKR